jgi:hypothetical protein
MGSKSVSEMTMHTTPMPTHVAGLLVLDAHRVMQRPGTLPSFVVLAVRLDAEGQPDEFVTWDAYDSNERDERVVYSASTGHYFHPREYGTAQETEDAARADYAERVRRAW